MLSNLDPLITADDCIEIFQNVGPVTKAVIHYNSDGSSQGTGEVQFANKTDALRAAEEYDAAQVDGRPMYVKVIANKVPVVQQRVQPVVPILPPIIPASPIRGRPFTRGAFRGSFGRGGLNRGGGGFRRGGSQRGRGSFRGNSRGNSRGRGGRGGGARQNKPTPTASQLDTEMDNYFKADTKADPLAAGQPANPSVAKKSKTTA
jgi:RNA recognition motif-containing protein